MSVDKNIFNEHVESASFQIGVDEGKWGINDNDNSRSHWPYEYIWIKASPKENCPDKYYFRFELSNYPGQAPTACPWDNTTGMRLESSKWPSGGIVSSVFNPNWNANALYAPCDRMAMPGHDSWKGQHPNLWWKSEFTIVVYLEFLYGLLNSKDYANS